jgi:hypothetical protein
VDVYRWREAAYQWTAAAAREAHTTEQSKEAARLAAAVQAVPIGTPGTMVDAYVSLAGWASCLMKEAIETKPRPPPYQPPPVPVEPPSPPWDLPDVPDLPDWPGLPGLPGWPKLDANLLLLALLIFAGGWILGGNDR